MQRKNQTLHKFIYSLGHIASPWLLRKYHYKTKQAPNIKGPYIVMANHATESDMFMMVRAFRKHMYFVCGEHLMRSKNADFLVKYVDPIPEFKGTVATPTAIEILRRIKAGSNVMIFPEGSRSFNGVTLKMHVATGKLVKTAKCTLVTYRIKGGYFIAPRWAKTYRDGPASGEIVGIYTPEQLSKMTPQEITELIDRDLYEDAYDTQKLHPQKYVGEDLAVGLENYLIICPKCGAYDSMKTEGDSFHCEKCGLSGIYDEYGYLRGDELPYDNTRDWGQWIEEQFDRDMEKRADEKVLFVEPQLTLYEITLDHKKIDHAVGDLTVRHDGLSIAGHDFPFSAIPAMSMLYYGKTLLFTCDNRFWGITGENYHAWKSNRLYDLYTKAHK